MVEAALGVMEKESPSNRFRESHQAGMLERPFFFRGVEHSVGGGARESQEESVSLLVPEGHWVAVCPVGLCGHPVVGHWY